MSKAELRRLIDELPDGAEQPALWLLRKLQGVSRFPTPQALAQAIVDDPDNGFLLTIAAASRDPVLEASSRTPRDTWNQKHALAPFDEEPLTAEDLRAVEEAHQDVREGRVVTQDALERKLGL